MARLTIIAIVLLSASSFARAQDDDARAKTLAQDILDRGSALFDGRDAAAMAATYVEMGQILLIKGATDQGSIEVETISGRPAIEKGYADLFKDRLPEHKSRNTVESARFLGDNTLLIEGRFALNRDQGDSIRFIQLRVRQGDQWKIVTLQMMPIP